MIYNIIWFIRNLFRRNFVDGGDVGAIDNRDFGSSYVGKIKEVPLHEFPKFNQYKHPRIGKSTCTITNAVKDVFYNYSMEFTNEAVFEAVDYCVKNGGYVIGKGWSTPTAMQYVRKWLESKGRKASYVRLRYTDTKLKEYLDKGYMVGCSFNGNNNYVRDYATEGILDGTKFGKRTFGHRTSMYGDYRIWDSEYGFKYNDYKLKDFDGLVRDGTFNGWFYVWTLPETLVKPVDELKRLKSLEADILQVIDINSKIRHQTNDTNYKNKLNNMNNDNRAKIIDIDIELKKQGN